MYKKPAQINSLKFYAWKIIIGKLVHNTAGQCWGKRTQFCAKDYQKFYSLLTLSQEHLMEKMKIIRSDEYVYVSK